MDRLDSILEVGRLHDSAQLPTVKPKASLTIHAIAIYVSEVVIRKYHLACDDTSMHAASVVVAHLIKLLLQLKN